MLEFLFQIQSNSPRKNRFRTLLYVTQIFSALSTYCIKMILLALDARIITITYAAPVIERISSQTLLLGAQKFAYIKVFVRRWKLGKLILCDQGILFRIQIKSLSIYIFRLGVPNDVTTRSLAIKSKPIDLFTSLLIGSETMTYHMTVTLHFRSGGVYPCIQSNTHKRYVCYLISRINIFRKMYYYVILRAQ